MLKIYARYYRDSPVGIIVAIPISQTCLRIGWSQCSKKDRFNKIDGTAIAKNRLIEDPIFVYYGEDPSNSYFKAQKCWVEPMNQALSKIIQEYFTNSKRYMEKEGMWTC